MSIKKVILLTVSFFIANFLFAQETILLWNFNDTGEAQQIVDQASEGNDTVRLHLENVASWNYSSGFLSAKDWTAADVDRSVYFTFSTKGYKDLLFSGALYTAKNYYYTCPDTFQVQYKIKNGNWTDVPDGKLEGLSMGDKTSGFDKLSLPEECADTIISVRFLALTYYKGDDNIVNGTSNLWLDDLNIEGTNMTPTPVTYPIVSFENVPVNKQLYARNPTTNKATITVKGDVVKSLDEKYDTIVTYISRDNNLIDSLKTLLAYTNDTAAFEQTYEIVAELNNYSFAVYGKKHDNTLDSLTTAKEVVAGDVFLIEGQSNAVANMRDGDASVMESPFIRAYGSGAVNDSPKAWFYGDGNGSDVAEAITDGHIGQWGITLANKIMTEESIPVAILNGGHGGQAISFFQRNDADKTDVNTNYGRLLQRAQEAGVANYIRGIIWHQGERDATLVSTIDYYKTMYNELYSDWSEDYENVEQFYIFQTKLGCAGTDENLNIIQEAQRQLANDTENVKIIATTSVSSHTDDCHLPFTNGYELIGNWVYSLISRDVYGETTNKEINSIEPVTMSFATTTEIEITSNSTTMVWEDGAESDFFLSGTTAIVSSGRIESNKIILTLSEAVPSSATLSYRWHRGSGSPTIKNETGIGLLGFYNAEINISAASSRSVEESYIHISPNPTDGIFSVKMNSEVVRAKLEIVDALGQLVRSEPIVSLNHVVNMSGYEQGLYFIRINYNNKLTIHKILIQ